VINALKDWTSSARIGCLGSESGNVSAELCKASPSKLQLLNAHFHASPERLRRLVVPSVYDTRPHMFAYYAVNLGSYTLRSLAQVRFGAVSSVVLQVSQTARIQGALCVCRTYTRSFADIDGQVRL
jgi:hypothetical protein